MRFPFPYLFSAFALWLLHMPQLVMAEAAPDFTLPGVQQTVRLQEMRGTVVYLDFWASWCTPCRQSFPWMNAMQQRHQEQGLNILAINLDEDEQAARDFLAQHEANFTIAFDNTGSIAEHYGLKGMPTSYLIDRDGQIVFTHVGFRKQDSAALEAKITSLLQQN